MCAITADAPDWYVCPIYKTVLGDGDTFEKICNDHNLILAPTLFDVLKQSEPPSIDWFRSLPSAPTSKDDEPIWAIYFLLLEKPVFPP